MPCIIYTFTCYIYDLLIRVLLVDKKLNRSQQYGVLPKKASCILGSCNYQVREEILLLYLAFVRPHLDYCVWFGDSQ